MERWIAKVLSLIIIFIIPFLCTLAPIKVYEIFRRKGQRGAEILSWLMCFGGGVFFATYILHMGPEVRTILNDALILPNKIDYPLSELIISMGFFLVLFMEKATLAIHRHRRKMQDDKCAECPFNADNGTNLSEVKFSGVKKSIDIEDLALDETHALNPCSCEDSGKDGHNGFPCAGNMAIATHIPVTKKEVCVKVDDAKDEEVVKMMEHESRSVILIIALSLHRIFEGMSVGLKHTTMGVWSLLLAVICHETVIGFSLGLQFVHAEFSQKRFVVLAFICSVIMPGGVAVGIIISELGGEGNTLMVINGILQAISTGTFIYVTFFEILQDEITHHDTNLGKVLSLFLGFLVMAALSAIPEPPEVLMTSSLNETLTTDIMHP